MIFFNAISSNERLANNLLHTNSNLLFIMASVYPSLQIAERNCSEVYFLPKCPEMGLFIILFVWYWYVNHLSANYVFICKRRSFFCRISFINMFKCKTHWVFSGWFSVDVIMVLRWTTLRHWQMLALRDCNIIVPCAIYLPVFTNWEHKTLLCR